MKRTSLETELKVIEKYKEGLSMAAVGKIYHISTTTVLAILDRHGVPKRTKGGIYQLPEDVIASRYQQGESCQVIADSYGVTFNTISNILKKKGIERNNKYYNLELDENYFSEINRADKAYFLGFMLTDGNVSSQENIIRLSLSSKDEDILNIFKEKTHSSNKLIVREDGRHSERIFQLRSHQWKADLAKYGVIPNKTATVEMPTLAEDMMPHLIRGMIDGDGWISFKSHQIGFCGNEKTVTQLRDYLVQKLQVFNVKVLHTSENLYQVTWASTKDIETIGKYLYANKEDCYLVRKYNNFTNIIQGNTEVSF